MNLTGEMHWHLDDDNQAVIKFSESSHAYSIDTILVPGKFRGQGIGSKLIGKILLLADSQDKEIYLSARPIGLHGDEALFRLVHYYERFGFQQTDRGLTVVYMRRLRQSHRLPGS